MQYSGMYNPESIVLSDTTPEQAERLAELLQARLRITSDRSFAVLYLPEGVQVEDVYNSDAYKIYLSAMSLDYYVSAEALSAAGQELISARPSFIVEDELYPQQSYLDYINLQDTWTYTKGEGITVAVIDSGIDTDHPDFVGRISDRSYDATDDLVVSDYGLEVIEDEDGHGTSVAGIIAAGMNDSVGITGIAPEVELIVIKCDTDGNGNFLRTSDLVFGLAYAIECDADVVTNPTCTEQGYTTHTCHCGDSYVDDYGDALGHEFGEWYTITAPTCVDDGLEQRDCIRCDHYETNVITATGHNYEDGTCTHCGQAELEYLLGDVNGDGEVDIFNANLVVGYYNGTVDLTETQILAADVNGDGEVDIFDANLIVAYYNGTIDKFPANE